MPRRGLDALDALAGAVAVPAGLTGAYLGALSLLASPSKPRPAATSVRFAFVVPAHNEALSIGKTIRSLASVDYPQDHRRIVVIADNCTDDTAEVARDAGADVLIRNDSTRRGKGYALDLAFQDLLGASASSDDPRGSIDAVVVVDADTSVSSNILQAFAAGLLDGEKVLQASYRVANENATWRTSLMAVAFACMHDVRSLGRERLGLSTGLRGNGMCFSVEALRLVPHRAASLVEDVEHGLDLGEAGIRVAFVHEASVEAEMPERAEESASQRKRWESGRSKLKRTRLPSLVRQAAMKRDPVLADLAIDLAIPPLARVALALGAAFGGSSIWRALTGRWPKAIYPTGIGMVGLLGHVVLGWRQSGTGMTGLRALFHVPKYLWWKVRLRTGGSSTTEKGLVHAAGGADEWVRTKRNAERDQTELTEL